MLMTPPQLLWLFDPTIPADSVSRLSIVQVMCQTQAQRMPLPLQEGPLSAPLTLPSPLLAQILFCRLTDLCHFTDVLRECTPPEQIELLQRLGYLNCIYTNKRDLSHLHGLYFMIRLSVEEVRQGPFPGLSLGTQRHRGSSPSAPHTEEGDFGICLHLGAVTDFQLSNPSAPADPTLRRNPHLQEALTRPLSPPTPPIRANETLQLPADFCLSHRSTAWAASLQTLLRPFPRPRCPGRSRSRAFATSSSTIPLRSYPRTGSSGRPSTPSQGTGSALTNREPPGVENETRAQPLGDWLAADV